MKQRNLKLAIVANGLRHQDVATLANRHLPEGMRLSEQDVTKLVTFRKTPSREQAQALAKVLQQPADLLFS